jgi:hypothetical protein
MWIGGFCPQPPTPIPNPPVPHPPWLAARTVIQDLLKVHEEWLLNVEDKGATFLRTVRSHLT